jgi:predicted Zn-dependent protease
VRTFLAQEGITVLEQQSFSTNSLNGYQGIATVQAQDGTELKLKLSALSYGGNVYRFLSYTTSAKFDTYRADFVNVENGFDQLYDDSILNIEPVRLDLVTVSRTAPFSSFLPNELPMDIQAIDIAIINQVEMDQTIQAGTVLKLPVQ